VYGFDADGGTACSGATRTCSPIWESGGYAFQSTPVIANDVLYIGNAAYDTRCPNNCPPIWTFAGSSPQATPMVANGTVYAIGSGGLSAYRLP
jgi:hypothetical protein